MFKTYNVADSLMQMNLFMALQVFRMSNLGYLAVAESEPEDETEQEEDRRPVTRKQRTAA